MQYFRSNFSGFWTFPLDLATLQSGTEIATHPKVCAAFSARNPGLYSVCTTWGLIGPHVDLLDVHRMQYLYPELLAAAMKLRATWKPKLIVIEKAVTGLSLMPDLVRKGAKEAEWLSPKNGKVERMVAQSARIEDGNRQPNL